jgi:hypothetical protein
MNRTLCRQIVLSSLVNQSLQIDGRSNVNVQLRTSNNEILVYQVTAVPKDKFDINFIKMSPYCIVEENK